MANLLQVSLHSSVFKKLTASLLVFSFVFSPIAPVFAQQSPESGFHAAEAMPVVQPSTPEAPQVPPNTIPTLTVPVKPAKSLELQQISNHEDVPDGDVVTPDNEMVIDPGVNEVMPEKVEENVTETGTDTALPNLIPNQQIKKITPDVDVQTGELRYAYQMTIPPGRNGMQPDISVSYSSNNTSNTSMMGYGWSLSIPSITRMQKNGITKMYTEPYFNSSLDGELVKVSSTTYKAKVDSGDFRIYTFENNGWVVKQKDGKTLSFGVTAQARQDNPADANQVFSWQLEKVYDTNNNHVLYFYGKEGGFIYPNHIDYGGNGEEGGLFYINFIYESRPDVFATRDMGFVATSSKRLSTIEARIDNNVVRKFELDYISGDNNKRSMLGSVTEIGVNNSGSTISLPPVEFKYGKLDSTTKEWDRDIDWDVPFYITRETRNYDDGGRFFDVNGDSLVDAVISGASQLYPNEIPTNPPPQQVWLNTGEEWVQNEDWTIPSPQNNRFGFTAQGADAGARFVDVNGDGFTDIVWGYQGLFNPSPTVYQGYQVNEVYLNNKINGWATSSDWTLPGDVLFIRPDNGQPGSGHTKIADVNADNLPDFLISKEGEQKVYLNTGKGWEQASTSTWIIPEPFIIGGSTDPGIDIADINGDRLPDIIRAFKNNGTTGDAPTKLKVYINTGSGWAHDTTWSNIPAYFSGMFHQSGYHSLSTRLVDVNSDGLVDLFAAGSLENVLPEKYAIFLNTGSGWQEDTEWEIASMLMFHDFANGNRRDASAGIASIDIDGDNMIDHVKSGPTPNPSGPGYIDVEEVYRHAGSVPDLLTEIKYPEGGEVTVEYSQSALYKNSNNEPANPHMQVNVNTVHTITSDPVYSDAIPTTYQYEKGEYFRTNATTSRFAGFGLVAATDADGNKTRTYLHQGNDTNGSLGEYADGEEKIGRSYRSEFVDAEDNFYAVSVTKWEKENLETGRSFVKDTQTIASTYDGDETRRDTASTKLYDSNGNVIERANFGEVEAITSQEFEDVGTDTIIATYEYVASSSSMTAPYRELLTNNAGAKITETRRYFDNLALGQINKGNVTKEEYWVRDEVQSGGGANFNGEEMPGEPSEPGESQPYYASVEKDYNSYGMVVAERDPRGKETVYEYDQFNLYPDSATNPLNQTTLFAYNYRHGKPRVIVDPNQLQSEIIYDALGRVVEEYSPDPVTGTPVLKKSYVYNTSGMPRYIQANIHGSTTGSIPTYQYIDGLGRVLQTRTKAEGANEYAVTDVVYNNRGQKEKESLPYFDEGSAKTARTTDDNLYTSYTYDPAGRVIQIENAVGTQESEYDDWTTTITDANNNDKKLYHDSFGRLVKVEEKNGNSTYSTVYTYTGRGDLAKITDALGNVRNFTYDGLGRRTQAEDLRAPSDTAFGVWKFAYDDAGNITSTLDPKSQTTNYTYDDLNRPLTENMTTLSGTEATYVYDTCPHGIGKLCSATKLGVQSSYEYNPAGGVSKESKVIDGVTYHTQTTYDRAGKTLEITHPDSSVVKYTYNAAGAVKTIDKKEQGGSFVPVVTNVEYGPHGLPTYQENANATYNLNVYDTAHLYRLARKVTAQVTPEKSNQLTGEIYIDDVYTYDPVGNITSIVDIRNAMQPQAKVFSYDDLNRLLSFATSTATTTGGTALPNDIPEIELTGTPHTVETYTYSSIGNITNKSDVGNYSYNGTLTQNYANPHAATVIGTAVYTYDRNGNVTTVVASGTPTITHAWNYDNTLASIVQGSASSSYSYDHSGNRALKNVNGTKTIYPTSSFEKQGATTTKYIYLGSAPVATVVGSTTSYIHTDHLGSTRLTTNASGTPLQATDYLPFGEHAGAPASVSRQYTGHVFDPESSLNYMNARYQNGNTGRFLSQDPVFIQTRFDLADPQSLNSYSYARNNPIVYLDPNGEQFRYFHHYLQGYALGVGKTAVNGVVGVYNSYAHPITTGNQIISSTQELGSSLNSLVRDPAGTLSGGLDALLDKSPIEQGEIAGGIGLNASLAAYGVTNSIKNPAISVSEYNGAVARLPSRLSGANLPTRAEIRAVSNQWANTTFQDKTSAIVYHHAAHGNGMTLQQLTNVGTNVWENYSNGTSLVRNVRNVTLGNGDVGLKINLTNRAGGIFTRSGKIISTWNDR